MSDADPLIWSLEQHFAAGMQAVCAIENDQQHSGPEPICHHFDAINPVDPMKASVEDTYQHLCARFAELGLDFLADRLEAWEMNRPNELWVRECVPAIFNTALASGLIYRGWSWEPPDRQPISASDVQVINNRIC